MRDHRGKRLREVVEFCATLPRPVEHIEARFAICRSEAYRHVAAGIEWGLLERVAPLRGEPALVRATREGMRFAGLGLQVARISPALLPHWAACSAVWLSLEREFGVGMVISEAELRLEEALAGEAVASAKLGEGRGGRPRLHRPDLAVLGNGRPIAIEVELTPKAPGRLQQIVRAWRRARCITEARYYAAPGKTRRAVERAVERAHARERVRVYEIEEGR
jgi:hypothetical protein